MALLLQWTSALKVHVEVAVCAGASESAGALGGSLRCNATLENYLCWPATAAGHTARINCPIYAPNLDPAGAHRRTFYKVQFIRLRSFSRSLQCRPPHK